MVMGNVQSGKTANYTGLIAKVLDAGYKLVVVLAGVHNSLRSQTQHRINEELLGYDLDQIQKFKEQSARIGVRELFQDHRIIQTLTNSSNNGDFKKSVANQAGIIPSKDGDPTIMVVKKNVSILNNLIEWSTAVIGDLDNTGRHVVDDVPLLVIDDECDFASVNTRTVVRDENGLVQEDCDPAKTNQRIREFLCAFRKSAYIGYTATPFANIFIHHDMRHPKYGEDLFPRNFVISLPQATNYIGPERVFGLYENKVTGEEAQEPVPLLRTVEDHREHIPDKHKKTLHVPSLPKSLIEAIKAFLLAAAVRCRRQASPAHDSMLVHVTRFTNVQRQVGELIERELRRLVSRIQNKNDELADFRKLWFEDFVKTSRAIENDFHCHLHEWGEIVEHLYRVAKRVSVRLINGEANDVLEYRRLDSLTKVRRSKGEQVPWEERGEHVIAIGGDKLSRGLTLDGLSVSYYLRASRMYDTLMQMGRWFGYREGYLDVCRIYTTEELIEWYRHIATASLELRHELEYMTLLQKEPNEFRLKVRSHPGRLAITSAGKMRNTERLMLSYAGRISETVVFQTSSSKNNILALEKMVRSLDMYKSCGTEMEKPRFHWQRVPWHAIVDFLKEYETHEDAKRIVDPSRMAEYIQLQTPQGELTNWHVVIISKSEPVRTMEVGDLLVGCVTRTAMSCADGKVSLRRLVNPADELLDLSEDEQRHIKNEWETRRKEKGLSVDPLPRPSGVLIREFRPVGRGLLLIYLLCSDNEEKPYGLAPEEPLVGFAISFPSSDTAVQINYVANSVCQDAED